MRKKFTSDCTQEYHEALKRDPALWEKLEYYATQDVGEGEVLELRHCGKCHSTLAVLVDASVLKKNPGDEPPGLPRAKEKFEEFHKHDAKSYGPFDPRLTIPDTIGFAGEAVYVAYNSNKWGERASYIHHHDCGNCEHEREDHYDEDPYPCEKWGCNCKRFRSNVKFYMPGKGSKVRVPDFIRNARTLTRLGRCLEFCYIGGDGMFKEHTSGKGFELFCIPSGKALLIIANKSRLVGMTWGGKLDVRSVGIVG